jgi:hypothetical protein
MLQNNGKTFSFELHVNSLVHNVGWNQDALAVN